MAAAWNRARSFQMGRSLRHRQEITDDAINLDYTKDPTENLKEILRYIITQQGVSNSKKLAYLNSLVKFFQHVHVKNDIKLTVEEILCCLRVSLFHDAREIRAAGLRAIRYFVQDEAAIDALWKLQFHHLIARSLDIFFDNQTERLQALRLMRKVAHLCPTKFPSAFISCLVSIANNGSQERDHVLRVCLATLSELVILNPEVVSQANVVGALLRNILDCQHARISEALVGTILFLLNHPKTRHYIKPKVDLERIIAPFTDCHYQHSMESNDLQTDEKEIRFAASKMAILSTLRSWPGLIRLCKPGDSGLQSLISVLHLPGEDVRKGIIDILFELFRIPIPECTSDFPTALLALDSSTMQETWKLYDGFVAEEGRCILPHLSYQRPNLVENYLALLLLAFINVGILEALVEVIVTSNNALSVKATILLGEILHLANTRLPHECSHYSHCLPSLIAIAASFNVPPEHRNRASDAVTCLNRLHALKKRPPTPCSIFLGQLMQYSQTERGKSKKKIAESKKTDKSTKTDKSKEKGDSKESDEWKETDESGKKDICLFDKENDELANQVIKDSHVLTAREFTSWDWELITTIFKLWGKTLKKLEDHNHKIFVRNIVHFYKATSKQFSHVEQTRDDARNMALSGCLLMDFLVEVFEDERMKLLDEFLTDFGLCLSQVNTERAPLDAIFSPSRMMTTLSQYYFLYIGRLSHTTIGRTALEKKDIFQYLLKLVAITSHECYLKLVISSLDYSQNGLTRVIFTKILNTASEASRLYATNFLRILIRLQMNDFSKWGMELLVTQVYDKARAVSLAALDILDEACDEPHNLEALINLKPSLLHLGDRGQLLLVRFMSLSSGFKYLHNANYVHHEMEKWRKTYNLKYVKIVEDELNDALTRHQRGDDGNFQRRSNQRHLIRDVYIPPHLYGQLVQHTQGLELLKEKDVLLHLVHTVKVQEMQTDEQILQLKAALWALGHIGTSPNGVVLLNEEQVIQDIVKLAEESPVFSIRGTCFNVLALLALTPMGVELLSQLGWESVRHNRREQWPTVKESELDPELPEQIESPSEFESDDDAWRSRGSSRNSMEELNGRTSFYVTDVKHVPDFDGLTMSNHSRSTSRLHPSISFDGTVLSSYEKLSLNEKSRTLPHSNKLKSPPESEYHQRSLSEPQEPLKISSTELDFSKQVPANRYPSSSVSVHSSPHVHSTRPRLKVSAPKERNRSRSFNDTMSPFSNNSNNSNNSASISGGKLRSVSNIEIVHCADYHECSKEERGESNDSSHASKSRSDSYTDSTSGIGSCDSNTCRLGVVSEHAQTLSPIASSTSLNTLGNKIVHHSDNIRKLVNLRHTPNVLRRVTSITQGQLYNDAIPQESSFVFTMTRDAAGYDALRNVQRRRIVSADADPWSNAQEQSVLYDAKTRSLEGGNDVAMHRLFTDFLHSSPYGDKPHRPIIRSPSSPIFKECESETENVRFLGLCLPIDINIIFMVDDREGVKTSSLSRIDEHSFETTNPVDWKTHTSKEILDQGLTGFEYHTNENCLKCCRIIKNDASNAIGLKNDSEYTNATDNFASENVAKSTNCVDASVETAPGSCSSTSSVDVLLPEKLLERIETDKIGIRKEVLRLVISLSSSIAIKVAEKDLLSLKQKVPSAFQDLCLYSEILNLMSVYNFRLPARRFLQELFLDATFNEVYEEPIMILRNNDYSKHGAESEA